VISNCYTGIVISEVNSPLKNERLKALEEIVCKCNVPENNHTWNIYNTPDMEKFWRKKYTVSNIPDPLKLFEMARSRSPSVVAELKRQNIIDTIIGPKLNPKCFSLFSRLISEAYAYESAELFPTPVNLILGSHALKNSDKRNVGNLAYPVYTRFPRSTFLNISKENWDKPGQKNNKRFD